VLRGIDKKITAYDRAQKRMERKAEIAGKRQCLAEDRRRKRAALEAYKHAKKAFPR
jgi:hypothetical protein